MKFNSKNILDSITYKIKKIFDTFSNMKKMKDILSKYVIWIIVAISILLLGIYLSMKTYFSKEGLYTQSISKNDNIKYIIISPKTGASYLALSSLEIYDEVNKKLIYLTDYTIVSSNGKLYNSSTYDVNKLSDMNTNGTANTSTYFKSGSGNCTLTITLNKPSKITKIFLKQVSSYTDRLRSYNLSLQNETKVILSEFDLANVSNLFISPFEETLNFQYTIPANTTPANTTPANTTPANTTPANTTPANTTPENTSGNIDTSTSVSGTTSDSAEQKNVCTNNIDYAAIINDLISNKLNAPIDPNIQISNDFQKNIDTAVANAKLQMQQYTDSNVQLPYQSYGRASAYNIYNTNQL